MTLLEKQNIFATNLAKFITYMQSRGYGISIREVERTDYQHAENLRTGKSKAKRSKHLDSLAFDCYLTFQGKLLTAKESYRTAAEYWESLNEWNKAGYSWGWDWYHFEFSL